MWGLGGVLLWSVALAAYDIAYRRLPDWLTLPAALLAIAAALIVDTRALIGLVWPAAYLALAWRGGGIGGGDIKLAVALGIWVAHHAGLFGVLVAMVIASAATVAGLLLLVFIRGRRAGISLAHGPAMLGAAWVVVLFQAGAEY